MQRPTTVASALTAGGTTNTLKAATKTGVDQAVTTFDDAIQLSKALRPSAGCPQPRDRVHLVRICADDILRCRSL